MVTTRWRVETPDKMESMGEFGRAMMNKPIKEQFDAAVSVIHSLPKEGPYQQSNMVKLKFYGLYKQATQGSNTTPKPGFWDPVARAKWEAWTACDNMTREAAMEMYINELKPIFEKIPKSEVDSFMQSSGSFLTTEEVEEEEEESTEESGGDSDGDLEFQDSYDDLPVNPSSHSTIQRQATPFVTRQGVSFSDTSLNASSNMVPLRTNKSDISSERYQTPPPILEENEVQINRGVRFSDKITAISPEVSEERGRGDRVSVHVVTEMFNQIQHNVLAIIRQFNNLIQVLNQQQSQESRVTLSSNNSHHNRSRRVIIAVVYPIVINILLYFIYNRNGASIPWWVWSVVTICNAFLSVLSVFH